MISQMQTVRTVVKSAPSELLHRAASYTIVAEGVFHTFHSRLVMVVVAGIIFLAVEVIAIYKDGAADKESFDA